MNAKKSEKADLRNKQGLFFQIGLIVALGITLAAFEYKSDKLPKTMELTSDFQIEEMDMIQITRPEQKLEEKIIEKRQAQAIEIVDDNLNPDQDIFIGETEADEKTAVTYIAPPEDVADENEPEIFVKVENMPEFPGGDIALLKTIAKNIVYPEAAKELNLQGKVYVSFVVNKQGIVDMVKIARGVDPILDNEALRVIKNLPNWKPGLQRGKPVNVSFTVPINFALN